MTELNLAEQRVCVTGGAGFLGRRVCDGLVAAGLPISQLFIPRRREFDLTRETDVIRMYDAAAPTIVVHLAAEVGGIGANADHPGRFHFANLAMGMHLIENARKRNIRKFVQVGTVCSYPKHTPVPFKESDLWAGYPEETNAPYGVAKKTLIVMLDAYRREYGLKSAVVLPANLYGPNDNFDLRTSHVIPALIRKFHEARRQSARSITCWGSGNASREFLYVDDAAAGIVAATLRMDDPAPINLGNGQEITIRRLAELIAGLSSFSGQIQWDTTQPDGQPRRCLDVTRAREMLQWRAQTSLEAGLQQTIHWWRHECDQFVLI